MSQQAREHMQSAIAGARPPEQAQRKDLLASLAAGVDKLKPVLKKTLPKNVDVELFVRCFFTWLQSNRKTCEKLLGCDRETLYLSIERAAIDGLLIDGREAFIAPEYNKDARTYVAKYTPMVQGIVKRARNIGDIATLEAWVVHENDSFSFCPGADVVPTFSPKWFKDRGRPIGAFAVCGLKSGEKVVAPPMSAERILKIAGRGMNQEKYDPETGTDWEEWWRKTVIKNVLKYCPSASEFRTIIEDNEFETLNELPISDGHKLDPVAVQGDTDGYGMDDSCDVPFDDIDTGENR